MGWVVTYVLKEVHKIFAKLVRPLLDLTKKGRQFIWSDECEKVFTKLNECFSSPDILAYPLDEGDYILDTDASDMAIGGVLSQIQNGTEKVIAYGSRSLKQVRKDLLYYGQRVTCSALLCRVLQTIFT